MAFDFDIMKTQLASMRDMNPVTIQYNGVKYQGFRDVMSSQMQAGLYGAMNAVDITVGLVRSDLKSDVEQGDKVRVFAPQFGRKGKELWVLGIREDAAGLSVRLDLESKYDDE